MNEVFNKYITHKMPFVVAKCAQTIDGKIATRTGASKWITSARARHAARKLRGQFDAILVGINTVLMDDPGLNPSNQKKSFKKIVLDSDLKISLQAKLFKGMDLKNCIIATTKRCSPTKRKQLIQKGVTVIECPLSAGHVQLRWLFRKLAQMRIASILIEGGSRVIGRALEHQLVDKMHIYISPQIMGDSRALSSVMGHKASRLGQLIKLKNIKVDRIGEDIFLSGYVHRHR